MPPLSRVPRNHGPRVLTGYTLNGYEVVILENALLRVVVNAGRGSHIPEFTYKPKDLDVLFKPPQGHLHHGAFLPSAYDTQPYFDHHAGGWFECFPNGGPAAEFQGGTIGFHGEVWGTPFEVGAIEESGEGCAVSLKGRTHRTPFELVKTFSLEKDRAVLSISEQITNQGGEDLKVLWGQHPTLGAPFVNAEAYIECAAASYFDLGEDPVRKRAWPFSPDGGDLSRVRPKTSRQGKMLYLGDLAEGKARVVSPPWKLAFELEWDAARFPYLWYYENAGSGGLPWYGRAYCLALEPFSGMGNAFEQDAGLIAIGAGETVGATFRARIVEG